MKNPSYVVLILRIVFLILTIDKFVVVFGVVQFVSSHPQSQLILTFQRIVNLKFTSSLC